MSAARLTRLVPLALALVGLLAVPVAAQSIDQITDRLDRTGRYLEPTAGAEIDAAIDRANDDDIAFVWLETREEAEPIAVEILRDLDDARSRYDTVLVLTDTSLWAESLATDPGPAAEMALDAFGRGEVALGIDLFTDELTGSSTPTTSAAVGDDNSSDGGFPMWLLVVVVAMVGVLGLLYLGRTRRARNEAAESLEIDRLEVREQLLDNADRVMGLGDRVIASGDAELIDTYDEATRTYQEVSTRIDGVTTVEEMDQLDDRIDHAEWQLEVIEARLEGREPPTAPPADDVARRASNDGPAWRGGESIFRRSSGVPRPRARRQPSGGPGRLGGVLGGIVLGGARPTTRRTRRRTSTGGGGGSLRRRSRGGGGSLRRRSRGGGGSLRR